MTWARSFRSVFFCVTFTFQLNPSPWEVLHPSTTIDRPSGQKLWSQVGPPSPPLDDLAFIPRMRLSIAGCSSLFLLRFDRPAVHPFERRSQLPRNNVPQSNSRDSNASAHAKRASSLRRLACGQPGACTLAHGHVTGREG